MKLKNISRLLVFGILLNNIPINSFASILSEDTRYETFTDSNITINDILEEDKTDIKIEGNTLVNLWSLDNVYLHDGMTISNGYVNVTTDGSTWFTPAIKNIDMLKSNTTYTIVTEIIDSTFDSDKILSVNIQRNEESSSDDNRRVPLSNGIYTSILTTKNDLSKATVGIRTQFEPDKTGIGSCKFRMIMLEGDYTNKQIPTYFEGLQSSFEDQLITQEMVDLGEEKAENLGKYKVEYKTTGKNLLNTELLDIGKMGQIANKDGQIITLNGTAPENFTNTYVMRIDLQANHKYTMHISNEAFGVWGVIRYIKDNSYHYITCNNSSSVTFVPLDDWKDIIFYYQINDAGTSFNNVKLYAQIEKGSKKSKYEPYKESINTFYLNSPLLKGDTIEVINGQPYHIHNYNKITLDSNKTYGQILNNTYTEYTRYWANFSYPLGVTNSRPISNNFISSSSTGELNFNGVGVDGNGRILVNISNSKISSQSVAGFKQWLSQNPTTVIYKLANPIYEPIKANLSVELFEGTTHISNNSTIPAIMEVTIDRTLNRAVEYTTLAKTNPTINNLSKARYWNNLLKDSIKKDQLQEEVNSITILNDMELERKNVTSNLDLYIKSENILMMSLSTNSITFEDFSGVEDMTKENTVQISINSSLPYSLNAYLPTEIQNSDKSVVMDKSILNIKENSENSYQTFANTTDKIILKDNNQAGNNLIHDIDIKLKGGIAHQKDVYKTTIKFETEQK